VKSVAAMERESMRSILTGKVYEGKGIKNEFIILEALDRLSQILTEKENRKLFYEQVANENKLRDFILTERP
jgi:hypothetical protein